MQDPFEDNDNVKDVFVNTSKSICPFCGSEVEGNSSFCPNCGGKLESIKPKEEEKAEVISEPKAPKKPRYDENHRLIREEGDEAPADYVPSHQYKYGDGKGHSISLLSIYDLVFAFFVPIVPLIVGLFGLSTENKKDRKLFAIAIVVNIIFTIIEAVYIWWQITH